MRVDLSAWQGKSVKKKKKKKKTLPLEKQKLASTVFIFLKDSHSPLHKDKGRNAVLPFSFRGATVCRCPGRFEMYNSRGFPGRGPSEKMLTMPDMC